MSVSRSVWFLAGLIGRGVAQRAAVSIPRQPHVTVTPLLACFSTSVRRFNEEGSSSSSSSESESDLDTEGSTHGSLIEDEAEDDRRLAVLRACLHMVREGGWSKEVLAEGAKEAGFKGEEEEMFPNGPGDLVNLFEQQCNERLYRHMEKQKGPDFVGSKVIQPSVEYRLRMLAPYIEKWPQAMALKAYPPVAPTALENLSLMVDDIWYMAGDRSTDLNWYSKRAILAAVYTATELYMVQDQSEDFQETWGFLYNRLQGVQDVSEGVNQGAHAVNQWGDQLGGVTRGALDMICAGLQNIRSTVGEMEGQK